MQALLAQVESTVKAQFIDQEGSHDWQHIDRVRRTAMLLQKQEQVCQVIAVVSYKGALVADQQTSLEGQIVRDADRLDAIGAIGIARAFAYGGSKNRALYNPDIAPTLHQSKEAYAQDKGHTINHFYEKLLLLKDRMETESAKKIAQQRHEFMLEFLAQFKAEWQ